MHDLSKLFDFLTDNQSEFEQALQVILFRTLIAGSNASLRSILIEQANLFVSGQDGPVIYARYVRFLILHILRSELQKISQQSIESLYCEFRRDIQSLDIQNLDIQSLEAKL